MRKDKEVLAYLICDSEESFASGVHHCPLKAFPDNKAVLKYIQEIIEKQKIHDVEDIEFILSSFDYYILNKDFQIKQIPIPNFKIQKIEFSFPKE